MEKPARKMHAGMGLSRTCCLRLTIQLAIFLTFTAPQSLAAPLHRTGLPGRVLHQSPAEAPKRDYSGEGQTPVDPSPSPPAILPAPAILPPTVLPPIVLPPPPPDIALTSPPPAGMPSTQPPPAGAPTVSPSPAPDTNPPPAPDTKPPPATGTSPPSGGKTDTDAPPPPPPPVNRLAAKGEKCHFGGSLTTLPCELGYVCLPDDAAPIDKSNTTAVTYGTCVYAYAAPYCNTTLACQNPDDECLAYDEQPVRDTVNGTFFEGVCAPRLPTEPEIYEGELGELCGNQTTYQPKDCKTCPTETMIWKCISSLVCLIDNRFESTRVSPINDFTLRIVGTCQYPGTSKECTDSQNCEDPLVCVKNTAGWFNPNISYEYSQCLLRGTGDECSRDALCRDPLVCLREQGASSNARTGRCGTWGPNAPNSTVPVFYKKPGDSCDSGNQCPAGFFCSTDINQPNSNGTNLFCIASAASTLTPIFIFMHVSWALIALYVASIFLL
eukprot:TRINITY_DN20928_c0_g1_i1.p1 TRINITY_DN20928_c0_g1~~TRINITY_DN20928_c0_g1_i1.p1  ORF type:complete len:496 (+),score=50.21 TRINITY_DN20928_c0_g1_i1:144-1631(+)